VEYFSDLLTVMQQIGNAPGLPLRIRLQCLLTASDILKYDHLAFLPNPCIIWLLFELAFFKCRTHPVIINLEK
jgi:hypothetical protein